MKSIKKPKRPNPFRSNIGFLNAYEYGVGQPKPGDKLPRRIAIVRVNRSGHQRVSPRPSRVIPKGW